MGKIVIIWLFGVNKIKVRKIKLILGSKGGKRVMLLADNHKSVDNKQTNIELILPPQPAGSPARPGHPVRELLQGSTAAALEYVNGVSSPGDPRLCLGPLLLMGLTRHLEYHLACRNMELKTAPGHAGHPTTSYATLTPRAHPAKTVPGYAGPPTTSYAARTPPKTASGYARPGAQECV